MLKRETYITWDEFFIGVAELASKRSKDPSTQNGACIIDPSTKRIVSVGYNGLPLGLDDNSNFEGKYDYWGKPQKYEYVIHAEENAIFNAKMDIKGFELYLYSEKGYYPCSKCARGIVQNGIKTVIMKTATDINTPEYDWDFTKHMFSKAGVKIRILSGEIK
jgi:dCMP deaminase